MNDIRRCFPRVFRRTTESRSTLRSTLLSLWEGVRDRERLAFREVLAIDVRVITEDDGSVRESPSSDTMVDEDT